MKMTNAGTTDALKEKVFLLVKIAARCTTKEVVSGKLKTERNGKFKQKE